MWKHYHINSTQEDFLQNEVADVVPIKLEKELILNIYHVKTFTLTATHYIYSNSSMCEREIHCFFQYGLCPF